MVCMQIQNREAPCIEWQSTHELSRSDKGFIIIHLLLRLYVYFFIAIWCNYDSNMGHHVYTTVEDGVNMYFI
jgi:hypothetical protein